MAEEPRKSRIPVKLHRQVTLVETIDPHLTEELLAHRPLARLVAGRLSDRVLLVHPDEETAVLEELRRLGHAARVAR
ncbi:hypothetical protein Isop_1829 [Isosphaera pallida ATCC 43644]|jgi:hypothetical protein|uniref:Uncharacterized protein n=1 Tax=Isosphaera pallida (strain ATCC 43644 / DSM 9630 / IS1B) TaxID=575540 RepID=E8R1X9_ISOPI|nr:hypothetical protein [Isosphaera pallida]ADV62411.1 hypothetical protein Isop_1829 [Isosphaera pallida ATCC 43644]